MKYIIFLFLIIYCLPSYAVDEASPTYLCGYFLIKYIEGVRPIVEKSISSNKDLFNSSEMDFTSVSICLFVKVKVSNSSLFDMDFKYL